MFETIFLTMALWIKEKMQLIGFRTRILALVFLLPAVSVCALIGYHLYNGNDGKNLQLGLAFVGTAIVLIAIWAWVVRWLKSTEQGSRDLYQHIQSAIEQDRKMIAIEIHDEFNALLVGTKLKAQQICKLAEGSEQTEAIRKIDADAKKIIEMMGLLYASARSIVRKMRPEVLELMGLRGAIDELIQTYQSGDDKIQFVLRMPDSVPKLEESFEITVYRLIQESLNNVMKHANATLCEISVTFNSGHHQVAIEIRDNGRGIGPASKKGMGMTGMKERVHALGGTIEYRSALNAGTTVSITLPEFKQSSDEFAS